MERPYLVNFSGILSGESLSIRAGVSLSVFDISNAHLEKSRPIDSMALFSKEQFRLKFTFLDSESKLLAHKEFETDNYGKIEIILNAKVNQNLISRIIIYEVSQESGFEFYLGSFIPLEIKKPVKIIISDFDKTLVDTKYHTAKEMYYSLNRPLDYFPKVQSSIDILKGYIGQDFQPFILSASPHFYEPAIRNWLNFHEIFASHISLKDYRDFISIFDGPLTTKDLKRQGFYKLNQLVDIILMTGTPKSLVLMGDGFESDPFIYLTLQKLLSPYTDPWKLWKSIKNHNIFSLTRKQDSYFLTKFYQINSMAKNTNSIDIKIHIRSTPENQLSLKNSDFKDQQMNEFNKEVDYYVNKIESLEQIEQNNPS